MNNNAIAEALKAVSKLLLGEVGDMEVIEPVSSKPVKTRQRMKMKNTVATKEFDCERIEAMTDNHKVAERLIRVAKELVGGLDVGKTMEKGNIRIHRYRSSIHIWDLTNAGKRGKRVDVIAVYDLDRYGQDNLIGMAEDMAVELSRAKTYSQAKKIVQKHVKLINETIPYPVGVEESQERGVDVAPADFKSIKIDGKHVGINADYKTFDVRDKDDKYNEPTCIPAIRGGKADVRVFYRWVQDNESKIKNMTFSQVMDGMSKAGVRYHYYCAVD